MPASNKIALVGSIPLANSEEVFKSIGGVLKEYLPRIPDGETGVRSYWIARQARVFHEHEAFESFNHDWAPDKEMPLGGPPKYRLKAGVDLDKLTIPSFGYPEFARRSYEKFLVARDAGEIIVGTRFQVSLPTPLSFYSSLIDAGSSEAAAPAIEREIIREANEIVSDIPAGDLSLQWDVCPEMIIWENKRPIFFEHPKRQIIEKLSALGDLVPGGAELGYHLCYGDFQHKHYVEPEDMRSMVDLANALQERLSRAISWIHFPVPRDRTDLDYFSPLEDLKLSPVTEVYLGLVHYTDGIEGTRRRMAAASNFLPEYGIATECGWGRRNPLTIPELLNIHVVCARGDL